MTTDLLTAPSVAVEESDKLAAICAPLMHRSRKTGLFRYPAKAYGGPTEEQQRDAIRALVSGARNIAKNPGPIMSRPRYEATRAKLRMATDALYALSTPLDRRYTGIDPFALVAPIDHIESEIAELRHTVVVVERDRGRLIEQAVSVRIAQLCYSLFGNVMLGVVAGLASALLNTRVERYEVRNWWRAFVAEQ